MDKRTVSSAHTRIDSLEKEVVEIKTEMKVQLRDVYNRLKRIEGVMAASAGAIILLLISILVKMS